MNARHRQKCDWDKLYYIARRDPRRTEEFILHDGPPYANGDLHIGHSLNKVINIMQHIFNLVLLGKCGQVYLTLDCTNFLK